MQTVLATLMEVAATLASLNPVFLGIVASAFQAGCDTHRGADPRHDRALALAALRSFVVGVSAVALAGVGLLVVVAQGVLLPIVVLLLFGQLIALMVLAIRAVGAIPRTARRS